MKKLALILALSLLPLISFCQKEKDVDEVIYDLYENRKFNIKEYDRFPRKYGLSKNRMYILGEYDFDNDGESDAVAWFKIDKKYSQLKKRNKIRINKFAERVIFYDSRFCSQLLNFYDRDNDNKFDFIINKDFRFSTPNKTFI